MSIVVIIFNYGMRVSAGTLKAGVSWATNGASEATVGISMDERLVQVTHQSHYESLVGKISSVDILGIAIVADPDAIASALALKRLFGEKQRK